MRRGGMNVRYTHSPAEYANEIAEWRAFRHLTPAAIKSFLMGPRGWKQYAHYKREPLEVWRVLSRDESEGAPIAKVLQ